MPKTCERDASLAIVNRSKVINGMPFLWNNFLRCCMWCVHQKVTSIFGHSSYHSL